MFRPSFSVVSGVLVTLCLLGLIATILRPYLPPAATNQLSLSEEDFLRRAAHQAIDWRELNNATLKRAKDERRPIFLVIGVVSSGLGQTLDDVAFSDEDIARFLNKNFIPIRVDGLHDPQWLNAFYPISRLRFEFLPGTQIWILTPNGELVDFIGRSNVSQTFDPSSMYKLVRQAFANYQQVAAAKAMAKAALIQRNDVATLSAQSGSVTSPFWQYRAALEGKVDLQYGGLPIHGLQQLYPNAWRFMCMSGEIALMRESMNPMLLSQMMDLLDGGFFRVSAAADYTEIEFNKVALEQAEMLLTLAMAWSLTKDDLYYYSAVNTYRSLALTMRAGNWIAAFQTEDAAGQRRSEHYSFSVAALRDGLSPAERRWATENLGLDVFRNPQMLPYLKNSSVINEKQLPDLLDRLRSIRGGRATLSGIGFLEVEGTVAARLIQAGRLLGEKSWIKFGEARLENMPLFESRKGLLRNVGTDRTATAYLGDYLAYSDAMLQSYLASGSQSNLERGLHHLLQVPVRFKGARPGEYRLSQQMLPFANTNLPEIADNFRESCTARALRLFLAYGRLFSDRPEGVRLMVLAKEISNQFALIAGEGGPTAGAFFCSAAELTDGMYAMTAGPNALQEATRLAQEVPTRFVAPARGEQAKLDPGIYILGPDREGPFSFDESLRRFPSVLSLPEQP